MELIDSPNIFLNPDLGNIYWCYDIPEESTEDAIVALAPHSRYWHCKNLKRVYIPENEHSIFLRTALPDGDIDYRFAITAMKEAGLPVATVTLDTFPEDPLRLGTMLGQEQFK